MDGIKSRLFIFRPRFFFFASIDFREFVQNAQIVKSSKSKVQYFLYFPHFELIAINQLSICPFLRICSVPFGQMRLNRPLLKLNLSVAFQYRQIQF